MYIKMESVLHVFFMCFYLFSRVNLQITSRNVSFTSNLTRIRRQDNGLSCVLPPHPGNGRWTVLNGGGRPGDDVDINTVIKFECDPGYKISAQSQFLICDSNWHLSKPPECEKLCPPLFSTPTTTLRCVDKNGNLTKCNEATDGTYLSYSCASNYEPPFGFKKNLLCIEGIWNFPKPVCQPVCGKRISDDTIPLLVGAKVNYRREYPWIAALFQNRDNQFINICGGSLISQRIVLTAAHCVTNDYGEVLSKDAYKVGVGKYYNKYQDVRDLDAQYTDLSRIVVHPRYRGDSQRFLADIAMLITKDLIILSSKVQPICYTDVNSIHLHAGNTGVVGGWGKKEDGRPSDELRVLEIPYKYETTCVQELPREWAQKYDMIDKICAGFYNKSMSVCEGDSGNSLFFQNPEDDRYYVHGIVSIGPARKGECNIQQNSLYTKVAFYYEFIDREATKQYVEQCLLPPYPENGKWITKNILKRPGDIVPSNTVLHIVCNQGYKASSGSVYIDCESAYNNMPTCKLSCSKLDLSTTVNANCSNPRGEEISCADAVDGSSLSFTCINGYRIPADQKNTRFCRHGSWGSSKPECELDDRTKIPLDTGDDHKDTSMKVICTYASWSIYKGVFPENFNATLCTHVVYDYIGVWSHGDVRVQNDNLELDKEGGLYRRVTDMKKRNAKLKVLLSVGGSQASNASLFSMMAADAGKRAGFIGSSGYFLNTYNFDGLNIEWDPTENEKSNYINLLREVKESFKKRKWILSVSVNSDPSSKGFNGREMNEILDWVTVKTYDMYGPWSAYTGHHSALYPSSVESQWEKDHLNVEASMRNWLNIGISKSKLILSIAFYGRSFILKDKNQHGLHAPIIGAGPGEDQGFLRYSEICGKDSKWMEVWDNDQRTPYWYYSDKWVGIDSKDSIWIKATYAKENGFSGVNAWPIDADDVHGKCGPKQLYLKQIHGGLGNNLN